MQFIRLEKVYKLKIFPVIQSDSLANLFTLILGINANAVMCFPFIILRYKNHKKNEIWINHEKIHLAQAMELGVLGFGILSLLERIYLFAKGYRKQKLYYNLSSEQECYINQDNMKYLEIRKNYNFLKYLKEENRKIIYHKDKKLIIKENKR